MKTTRYFDEVIRRKRPEIEWAWVLDTLANPETREVQNNGRISHWKRISMFGNRALRVVTLEDGQTILNAFFDRNYRD